MTSTTAAARLAAPAVWAIAAALAVVAPFLHFYTPGSDRSAGLTVDGFGRERLSVADNGVFYGGGPSGEHAVRIGIALLVAAAILLVAVGCAIARPGRPAAVVGLIGSVATIFTALSVLLDAQAAVSENTRQLRVTLGAGAWLALAAGVLGVVGAVLAVRVVLRAD